LLQRSSEELLPKKDIALARSPTRVAKRYIVIPKLEGLGLKYLCIASSTGGLVGIFKFYGHLVFCGYFSYICPILVCCTKKNLATLSPTWKSYTYVYRNTKVRAAHLSQVPFTMQQTKKINY
jgi:hypothetical protein